MHFIDEITESILEKSRESNFCGHDPFDGLNSRIFTCMPVLKNGILGLLWTQLHKVSPINFRPAMLIPKMRNPKGIALYILGMIENDLPVKDHHIRDVCVELADWLVSVKSDPEIWPDSCWGYHFDWKARAFYVPKGKPNVITTIYVSQALYRLGRLLNRSDYIQEAFSSANFIVEKLYTFHDSKNYFAYIPGETAFVHNASLWGAAWVAFVGSETNNDRYRDLSLLVARQSVRDQLENGSWVYGSSSHHQFIDGFHTGYNLEALSLIRSSLEQSELTESIDLGYKYYRENFFTDSFDAKYYNDNVYPLDMHSVAQAIITLLGVGGGKEDYALADRVISRSIEQMFCPRSRKFFYQKTKWYTNRIDYTRWTQAWVYYSFSYYNRRKRNFI
ncbi:hypothetical protein [uncultured Pseudoteredinibacter sp.]|uniref:hypothetical protein n=1 Tax=uncultured Pseudoteredinibacter sp. TaxID=1641701 RepID=UPI00263374AD|nr:hypothetical protein [uncultured Pseudoteredinibacter sp.]